MSYYSDIYKVSINGPKDAVISMLNSAILKIGKGNMISEDDDVETIIDKLKEKDSEYLLRLSIIDLLDDECLQDNVIVEKKDAFEKKMNYYKDVQDGKVSFESEDEECDARYHADMALENIIDGRSIGITGFDIHDDICEVRLEFYVGEEDPMPYPDWVDWTDLCRLYGCRIVIDDDEFLNGGFYEFCGTTIYEIEEGIVKKSIIKPELGLWKYLQDMDKLVRMDSQRYLIKKIKDIEVKIRQMQYALSDEKLSVELGRLDETDGHLQVPEGVTSVSNVLWRYSKKIKSIYIPASVDEINKHSISSSNIESIEISPDNPYFVSVNNCILNKEKTTLLIGCDGSVIPDGITTIEDSAFSGCRGLKEISIPPSVERIGRHVFDNCSELTRIVFNEGLKVIGCSAFMHCTSLVSIRLPESLEDLPLQGFYGCTSLVDVTMPGHLKDSDGETFKNTPFGGGVEKREDSELPF